MYMCGVYFIENVDSGLVKIGSSSNISRRIRDIQLSCPVPLKCAGYIQTKSRAEAYALESKMHRLFRKNRRHGEWFCGVDLNIVFNQTDFYGTPEINDELAAMYSDHAGFIEAKRLAQKRSDVEKKHFSVEYTTKTDIYNFLRENPGADLDGICKAAVLYPARCKQLLKAMEDEYMIRCSDDASERTYYPILD